LEVHARPALALDEITLGPGHALDQLRKLFDDSIDRPARQVHVRNGFDAGAAMVLDLRTDLLEAIFLGRLFGARAELLDELFDLFLVASNLLQLFLEVLERCLLIDRRRLDSGCDTGPWRSVVRG